MHALGALAGIEVVKRIGEFVERSIGGQAAIQKFSEATGIAAEEVAALGKVGFEADVSMEGVQGTLMSVASATGQAAMGIGRNVKLFQALKISAKDSTGQVKSSIDVLEELADKFKGMSASQRLAIAGRLGIDANMAAMMAEEGSAGFRAKYNSARSAGILTNSDYEQADKTEKAFERMQKTIQSVVVVVANALSPWVEKVLNTFQGWWKTNRPEVVARIKSAFAELAGWIEKLWEYLNHAWESGKDFHKTLKDIGVEGAIVKTVIGGLILYKVGAWALAGAAGVSALTASMLALKIRALAVTLLIGGLAIGIALLIEDINVWRKDGDSVLKDLSQKWPVAVPIVTGLILAMAGAWVLVKLGVVGAIARMIPAILSLTAAQWALLAPFLLFIAGVAGMAIAANDLKESWNPVMQWFEEVWDGIADQIAMVVNAASEAASFLGIEIPKMSENHQRDRFQKMKEDAFNATPAYSTLGGPMMDPMQKFSPAFDMQSKNAMFPTTTVSGTTINIKTTDPEKAGRAAVGALADLAKGNISTARNAQSSVER
jgi:hypothetical protein